MRALLPDFLSSGGHVQAGTALIVRDGKVLGVGKPPEGAEVIPMRGRALLPGLVAAHSHAFQRAIRGRTEHRSHARDDVWSWREAMYAAAERLTPDDLHSSSKFCLLEMAPVGAAPHSVRACPLEWIRDIAAEAFRRGWPLHLHVSEQRAEVEQSQAEHGTTPALVLERLGALRESTTAVHGVHLTAQDIAALGRARATVCACPTTERNLGDGVVRADLLLAAGARLCVGSDSEVQISPLEDARQLEYHLRLLQEQRAVLDAEQGGVGGLGAKLYAIASEGGMRSLGLGGGALRPGEPADFIVVDLDDPSIAGCNGDDLMANAVFSMERTAIRETWVNGEPLRLDFDGALPGFRAAMRRLWG